MSEQTKAVRLEQDAAGYVPVSTEIGKACSGCRWFSADEEAYERCHLVMSYPAPIAPNGYCNRFESLPPPEVLEVVIVETPTLPTPMGDMGMEDKAHDHGATGEAYITPALNTPERTKELALPQGTTMLKAANGQRLMFMVTTNSYRDRENETLLSGALKAYVDSLWTDDGVFMGDRQQHYIWHVKALGSVSDLAYADLWGAFLVEVWLEKPTMTAKAYYDFVEAHPEIQHGASHGFFYTKANKVNGEYRAIHKFESSTLPLNAAANLLTFSGVIGDMGREDYFKTFFKERFNADVSADELRADFEGVVKRLSAAGVEHKSTDAIPAPTVNLGSLFTDLLDSQAAMAATQDVLTSANKALTEENARLVALVGAVDARLKALEDPKTLASEDARTAVNEVDAAAIKKQLNPVKIHDVYGVPVKAE